MIQVLQVMTIHPIINYPSSVKENIGISIYGVPIPSALHIKNLNKKFFPKTKDII